MKQFNKTGYTNICQDVYDNVIFNNNLSSGASMIYVLLLRMVNEEGFKFEDMCEPLGKSLKSVTRYIKELKDEGLLTSERIGKAKYKHTLKYHTPQDC